MSAVVQNVQFSPHLKKKISYFSALKKCTEDSLIEEALEKYIDLEEWKMKGVEEAIEQMDNGKGIDGKVAMDFIDALGTEKEYSFSNIA